MNLNKIVWIFKIKNLKLFLKTFKKYFENIPSVFPQKQSQT